VLIVEMNCIHLTLLIGPQYKLISGTGENPRGVFNE
jgi:hypothetical protein